MNHQPDQYCWKAFQSVIKTSIKARTFLTLLQTPSSLLALVTLFQTSTSLWTLVNKSSRNKESDLYPPLKRFLESQNYEVKGEVQDCDVLAVNGEEVPAAAGDQQ